MKSNIHTRQLILDLKKAGRTVPLWKRIASELDRSTRKIINVNISKIDKHIKDGEIAIVPGKVLSLGALNKKTTIAAFSFSEIAKEKINKNGEAITIAELLKKNPKGSKVRIIK
ncbi:MAG: 50S ribosomal protein L18e [Nanoarchaeota archaeon]|nr:50S ribosomal protein L18e [Nanoarchaeota archaeon]